jgi:hypothetical protein
LQVGDPGLEIRHLEEIVQSIMTCTMEVDELDQITEMDAKLTLYFSWHANMTSMIE